jgi:hypothetical protein
MRAGCGWAGAARGGHRAVSTSALRPQQTTASATFLFEWVFRIRGVGRRSVARGVRAVPKILRARPPRDDGEERKARKLAGARHAPADWTERARIVALSWDGLGVPAIAGQLGCHPKKVRRWLYRFNADIPASGTPSSPRAPAGSTCKRPGGGSSARPPWPGRTSPTPARSPTPPGSPPPSSTPGPGPGSGDGPRPSHAPTADALYTPFKERSTSPRPSR